MFSYFKVVEELITWTRTGFILFRSEYLINYSLFVSSLQLPHKTITFSFFLISRVKWDKVIGHWLKFCIHQYVNSLLRNSFIHLTLSFVFNSICKRQCLCGNQKYFYDPFFRCAYIRLLWTEFWTLNFVSAVWNYETLHF